MNNYYVYELLDPSNNNLPFYIGKGMKNRVKRHYTPSSLKNDTYKDRVILGYRTLGYKDTYNIIQCDLSEDQAHSLEVELIKKFGKRRDGGILTNLTDGGEGTSGFSHPLSVESRAHLSKVKKCMKMPRHVIEAANAATRGKSLSKEHKEKLSKIATGRKMPEEDVKRRAAILKGRKLSPELKEKALEGIKKANDRIRGKLYEVTFPDGHTEIIRNLSGFSKEHNLSTSHISRVVYGERNHHKNFKFKILDHLGENPGKRNKEP